ncbi:MAG: VWA domain-containing protein [Phycisphaerales bacterium]|nr:VWA domain-containing protein [Phycisphaerales bacterium]
MTWLTPLIAGIAAAIAVPSLVILYFLKLRRRDMEVSTTLLWKKAIQDIQANAPFQKLRRNILLILQIIALAAAIAAVGQPQLSGDTTKGDRHIILIDRSASMNAIDGDPAKKTNPATRLEIAKKQAEELVDTLREPGVFQKESADQAMVIAFDSTAEVRQQFTSDKSLLKAAIRSIAATDGPTRLTEAMRLATAHSKPVVVENRGLVSGPGSVLHLFGDGKMPDTMETQPGANDTFMFHRVGEPESGNVAIANVRAERAFDNPSQLSIFVGLQSTMRAPRAVDVELTIDGAVAGVKAVTMPPATSVLPETSNTDKGAEAGDSKPPTPVFTPSTGGVVFPMERVEGALVSVRLRGLDDDNAGNRALTPTADVLPTDDAAYVVVPPAKRLAVAIVSAKGNLFLSAALDGLPLSRHDVMTPEQFQKVLAEGRGGEYDVFVLDGWVPAPDGDGSLPPGRYVIFNAVPPGAGVMDKGVSGPTQIVDWDRSHPVMRSVNLDPLIIGKNRAVEVVKAQAGGAGADVSAVVLASTTSGASIVEARGADWRAVIVPWDLMESNWPFDVGFIVFTAQAVGYVGGSSGGVIGQSQMVQPGAILSDRLPTGASNVTIESPAGESSRLEAAADGRVVFGPIRAMGFYRVSWTGSSGPTDSQRDGRNERFFAANLLDSRESDAASADKLELASRPVAAQDALETKGTRKLWPWFLLGALAVVMLEWFVYNRKVHV